MSSYKWLWKHLAPYAPFVALAFLLVAVSVALSMVSPYLAGVVVDKVIVGHDLHIMWVLLAAMVGATALKSIGRFSFQMIFETVSQKIVFEIRTQLLRRLHRLDFSYFDQTKIGDIMTKMTGDIEAVRHFLSYVIYGSLENGSIFVFSVVVLFAVNWQLAAVLFSLTPLIGFLTWRLSINVKPTFTAIRDQFEKLNSLVQENIAGNRVVRAFVGERDEMRKFERANGEFKDKNMKSAQVWSRYIPMLDSLSAAFSVITILVGGIFVIRHMITIGQLVTFNGFTWALINPMRIAGWLVNDTQRFRAAAEKIIGLEGVTPRIISPAAAINPTINGEIEFKNVMFGYRDELVLNDVSFRVPAGGTIGIIGPTGSGKTTIAQLICRFYQIWSGQILIDGIPVENYDLQSLRSQIGIAMQDVFLFSDTIEGNIAYGRPDAPYSDVHQAAVLAAADDFIREMPEGYDTIIGERGVGVSGGQRQRIALARMFLTDPPVAILDDTTSNVDVETEREIRNSIREYKTGRTTIIISHRISSVLHADEILVLADGRIAERGTHAELVARGGYYAHVFAHQGGTVEQSRER